MKVVADSIWPNKIPSDYIPTTWDYTDVVSAEEWDQVWTKIKTIPNFWSAAPAYEQNITELNEFLVQYPDTRIFFITARISTGGVSARRQTQHWLEQFGLYPRHGDSTVLVTRPELKVNLMAEARIKFSVDDKMETVAACNKLAGHKAYLFNQPWNQDSDQPRVHSVREYLEIIQNS